MAEHESGSYDAGHIAGRIDERLAGHDEHFKRINGSIERSAKAQESLTLAIKSLDDRTGHVETRLERAVRIIMLFVGLAIAVTFLVAVLLAMVFD